MPDASWDSLTDLSSLLAPLGCDLKWLSTTNFASISSVTGSTTSCKIKNALNQYMNKWRIYRRIYELNNLHNAEDVKTRNNRICQFNILCKQLWRIISANPTKFNLTTHKLEARRTKLNLILVLQLILIWMTWDEGLNWTLMNGANLLSDTCNLA